MAAPISTLSPPVSPSRRQSALRRTSEHPLQQLQMEEGLDGTSSSLHSSGTFDDFRPIAITGMEIMNATPPPLSSLAFPVNLPLPSSSNCSSRGSMKCEDEMSSKEHHSATGTASNEDLRSAIIALKLELAQSKSEADANKCASAAAHSENTALRTEMLRMMTRREMNDTALRKLRKEAERLRCLNRPKSMLALRPRAWARSSSGIVVSTLTAADGEERGETDGAKSHCDYYSAKEMKPRDEKPSVVQLDEKDDNFSSSDSGNSTDLQCPAVLERNTLLMENSMLMSEVRLARSEVDKLRTVADRMEVALFGFASPSSARPTGVESHPESPLHKSLPKQTSSRWNLLKCSDFSVPTTGKGGATNYVPLPPESLLWDSQEDLKVSGQQLAKRPSSLGGLRPTAA